MDPQSRERRYIANPNFLGPSSSSNPPLGPSTQQSNPQIGPPDPFHRNRDSFRLNSHAENRENGHSQPSYWQSAGAIGASRPSELQHRDVLQPGPPPPPFPFSRQPPFGRDHPRRASLSGEHQHDSAPQPPPSALSFYSRNMPPPASSPHHSPPNTLSYPLSRGSLRSPASYGPPRDTTAPSPTQRPANMSISSIMGTDSPATSRAPAWSPPSISNGRPLSHHGSQPLSPRHTSSYGPIRNDTRPPTHSIPQYGPVNSIQYSNSSGSGTHTGSAGSPKTSPTSAFQPSSDAFGPSRPFSQPGLNVRPRSRGEWSRIEEPMSHQNRERGPAARLVNGEERDVGSMSAPSPRDRAFSDITRASYAPYQPTNGRHIQGPPPRPPSPIRRTEREDGSLQYGRWSPRQVADLREADRPIASREGPQLPPEQLEGPMYGPFLPHDPRATNGNGPSFGPYARPIPSFGERSAQTESATNSFNERHAKPLLDAHLRKSLEDSQMSHRSILGASQDSHRRLERSSPLPQAVQGASSQPVGSARDPTIKSEFGRMFSGLGSGVGSTPVPMAPNSNGSPTPNRGLHGVDNDRRTSHPDGIWDRPSGSPGVERLKRAYEANGRVDMDGIEGRMTPGFTRGKRAKHIHATPHHHHHPLGPHHHHRIAKADEDTPTNLLARRISSTPFNQLAFNNSLPNGPATPSGLRGHHHHGLHHHHHHRTPLTPTAIDFTRPVTTIMTNPLVKSVSTLPRKHLGSQLYAPSITPPRASTPSFFKFQFASKSKPLPLFEGKENCTFTLRIPRDLLADRLREHVVSERQVWGTDVYTDDSDVLAAAIHSGWIRGAWSEEVDVSMLELNSSSTNGGVNGEGTLNKSADSKPEAANVLSDPPETGPVPPPPNRDAHVTILILPPLEKYSPCTWHGMRSRAWGDNHDGMSFKIHKIEWVDEGPESRWSEKGAKATAKRLAENRRSMARCGVPRRIKAAHKAVNGMVAA